MRAVIPEQGRESFDHCSWGFENSFKYSLMNLVELHTFVLCW